MLTNYLNNNIIYELTEIIIKNIKLNTNIEITEIICINFKTLLILILLSYTLIILFYNNYYNKINNKINNNEELNVSTNRDYKNTNNLTIKNVNTHKETLNIKNLLTITLILFISNIEITLNGTIKFDNFNSYLQVFFLILIILILNIFKNFNNLTKTININIFFFLTFLFILSTLIFLNNDFIFIFLILEGLTLILLINFILLKNVILNENYNNTENKNFNFKLFLTSNQYYILINFIITIILLIYIYKIIYYFGSTELNLIIYLMNIINNIYTNEYINFKNNINLKIFNFYALLFILSFLLKLGTAPLHFYKIEIYKGLNIFSILIYTLTTILTFLIFFIYFWFKYNNLLNSFNTILPIILFIFFLILGFFLNDINSIKIFLAFSSIFNISSLIIANFLLIN